MNKAILNYKLCLLFILAKICLAFAAYNWPIMGKDDISSVFGPRNIAKSTDSWCHTGIDLANCREGDQYYAPFNLEVVAVGTNRLDCKNTFNTSPEYVRFEHVFTYYTDPLDNTQYPIRKGDSFQSPSWITTIAPWSGGTHLHFDTWAYGQYFGDGNVDYYAQKKLTSIPMIWFSDYENPSSTSITITPNSASGVVLSDEVGKYVKVIVTQARPAFSLTGVELLIYGTNGAQPHQMLLNQSCKIGWSESDFNMRNNAQPTGSNTWVVVDNVKIIPSTFAQNIDKTIEFRFYLVTDAPTIRNIKVNIIGKNFVIVKSQDAIIPVGVADKFTITAGPKQINYPTGTTTYTSNFTYNPSHFSKVDSWNWELKFYTMAGEYVVATVQNLAGYNQSTWVIPAFSLPNSGYTWRYDPAGNIRGKVTVSAYDSDNFYHSDEWDLTLVPQNIFPLDVVYQNQTVSTAQSDVKAHNMITLINDQINSGGIISFKAGSLININNNLTIQNGSNTNFVIDPTLR